MATEDDVIFVFGKISANWPWANMTKETLAVWVEILADTDTSAMQAAMAAILSESGTWPPTAGTIRTRALDLAAGPESAWEDAWNAIWQHARECRAPEYLCPHDLEAVLGNDAYQALQAMGGWGNLMRSDVSTHATVRAQFRDIYRTRVARAQAAARLPAAVTALLEAARPAQITPAPRAPTASTPAAQPDTIRSAPRNWQRDTGSRSAELATLVRRIGGVL